MAPQHHTTRGVISALLLITPLVAQAFGAPKLHYFQPPPVTAMPDGTFGALVRQGYDVFKDTPKYAPRYAGNGLSCGSCHLDNGRKPNAIPMWGAAGLYPKYEPRVHQVIILANMPFDNPGSLKPQQAKDIAAWIRLQWRDPNPRRGILGWLP